MSKKNRVILTKRQANVNSFFRNVDFCITLPYNSKNTREGAHKKSRANRPSLSLPYYLECLARTMDGRQCILPYPPSKRYVQDLLIYI